MTVRSEVAVCPTCDAAFVSRSEETQTLVGYFSPPGHNHDDNCRSRTYTCANGHATRLSIQNRCSDKTCTWNGQAECFCHVGRKLTDWPPLANSSKDSS